jgi:hypothetical protein
LRPFEDANEYVSVAHGLIVQQPVVVFDVIVLKGCRAPLGVHPAMQTPLPQFGVCAGQTLPHVPQLFLSPRTSMHDVPQYSVPSAQQFPSLHHSAPLHAFVHEPQWSWWFSKS